MPVASNAVPSVIASSVCWSLQCLVSALTQRGRWRTLFFFFRLTCSVALWGGRALQTNNTGVCSQCLSHAGPAPIHGACSLPAHNAQVLGCSTGYHLRLALGCLHLPGPSCSEAQTRLGLRFVLFPGPSSSADGVFGKRHCCNLSPPCRSVT